MLAVALSLLVGGVSARCNAWSCRQQLFKAVQGDMENATSTVRRHTWLTGGRLHDAATLWIDALARDLPGDWIETGVWKGGTSLLAAKIAVAHSRFKDCCTTHSRTVWLADSFEGLPPPREEDSGKDAGQWNAPGVKNHKMDAPGSYAVDLPSVRSIFLAEGFNEADGENKYHGLVGPGPNMVRVRFAKGWFKDTLTPPPMDVLAVLRVDGDMYTSTMDAMRPLYPLLQPSGFLIIDDYGHWVACQKAIDDYFQKEQGWMPALMHSDYTGRWMQKPVALSNHTP